MIWYDMNMIWIWYEYDMNMIWIWYEYDMNMKWIWYEYDMNMIWIWYEYDMNMIWIWYEYDMNMIWIWRDITCVYIPFIKLGDNPWIYLSIPKAYFPLNRCLKLAISSWEGKNCAVTGASEGLGAVIALHLAQVGVTCHETTCLGTEMGNRYLAI